LIGPTDTEGLKGRDQLRSTQFSVLSFTAVAATVSHRWMFGSITAQLGALEVQMVICDARQAREEHIHRA
jgi:hypothetical protein